MPLSDADSGAATEPAGKQLAVVATGLFVANLTVAPGLAFVALAWLWRSRRDAPRFARHHLDQSFHVSLRGGAILVGVCALIIVLGGMHWPWTWIVVVAYFTCIHSTLVICGCIALAKAMSGQDYRFPLLGVPHAP